MSDDVRRAAENILATVVSIRDSNGEVVIQSRCWLWAREVAQAYLAQQRADETEGGYAGWTIVAEGEDGSLLLQSKTGARRRISYLAQQREADDDKPIDGLWLASLGPLKRGDYELQISVDGYCAWWHGDRGMYLCHAHTRGQVRRLLEALGIEGE